MPYVCSLRVTDATIPLATLEHGVAELLASGRVREAALRFDYLALTLDAADRDAAEILVRALLREIGVTRVTLFAVLGTEAEAA